MTAEPLRGPRFGSYAPDDVAWLLTDLSGVPLERPVGEREAAVQSGRAHYAEALPIEYQPSEDYHRLFDAALNDIALRIAHDVGMVAELIRDRFGDKLVLASLARAGTPIGILIRRWLRRIHGLDAAHYAISIVRGRGIDRNALRYLADHHDPATVVFVDAWTGKGAIARELATALADDGGGFRPEVAVVADPGGCTALHGTRDDYLIPSACLNSTVSGLVSRTVLNTALIGPGDFHGAKFYAELVPADRSHQFLDAVTERFADVATAVARDWPGHAAADRTPTWAGREAVARIGAAYGITDLNLVKPGVGETTRVLLRRVPWKILIRTGAGAEIDHIRLLAAQRGVSTKTIDGLPYTCVGLIQRSRS